MEWQMPLYVCFIDFEKAFDSVDRQAIWDILHHYSVPDKIISVIRRLHEGFACQVKHSRRLSEDFEISTGVRQGCMLSPLLFLVVLDWVMRTAYVSSRKGIQWTFLRRLEDLEFADDLALLSHCLQDVQDKVNALSKTPQRVGLRISQDKTKLLRTNNQQEAPVTIEGAAVEDVSEFVYLGSKMSKTEGTDEDIKARIKKAQQAFAILRPVWKSTAISVKRKLWVFHSSVKAVLLYGSETWKVTANISKKIQTFVLTNISGRSTILSGSTECQTPSCGQGQSRNQWSSRSGEESGDGSATPCPKSLLTSLGKCWNGTRRERGKKRGHPKQTWRRSLHSELGTSNLRWETAKVQAKDRR